MKNKQSKVAANAIAFAEELAAEDCSYGDNCPTFGSKHGRCLSCKAKAVLTNNEEDNK